MRDRSGFGWLALIVSILLVLLGIATFIWPEAALESFVMVYGVLAVATGIMDIVFYARVERHTGCAASCCWSIPLPGSGP